jgi:type IV pilus assembly protein PilM
MNLLPQPTGARPRVACEISAEGVVAARSLSATTPLSAVARVKLAAGAVQGGLRPGNLVDRVAVVTAIRRAFEDCGLRAGVDVTLVVPDAAVRVLLLDFDALPGKLVEALPLVRFRLKKLLPFDADDAMVSYQVMTQTKGLVRVLVVAMPKDVLAEYESAMREAGFDPGAVLPSTLAALAALEDSSEPALVINANVAGVTAAIARGGLLLLHRSVDLQAHSGGIAPNLPAALFEASGAMPALPLVDADATQAEWAAQEAMPEHGRNPYADRVADEEAVQNIEGVTSLPAQALSLTPESLPAELFVGGHAEFATVAEPAPVTHSPYAANTVTADLYAEKHNSILMAPTSMGEPEEEATLQPAPAHDIALPASLREPEEVFELGPEERNDEIAQAVSIATAYFEDTLSMLPEIVLSAGPLGAEALQRLIAGVVEDVRVRELVSSDAMLAEAVTASVPRGWLAGVTGALRA